MKQSMKSSNTVPVTCVTPVFVVSCGPVLKMYIIDCWNKGRSLNSDYPIKKSYPHDEWPASPAPPFTN